MKPSEEGQKLVQDIMADEAHIGRWVERLVMKLEIEYERRKILEGLAQDCAVNWDCDVNKLDGVHFKWCRKCAAQKILWG